MKSLPAASSSSIMPNDQTSIAAGFCFAIVLQEHILRVDISVGDAMLVGEGQDSGQLAHGGAQRCLLQRPQSAAVLPYSLRPSSCSWVTLAIRQMKSTSLPSHRPGGEWEGEVEAP